MLVKWLRNLIIEVLYSSDSLLMRFSDINVEYFCIPSVTLTAAFLIFDVETGKLPVYIRIHIHMAQLSIHISVVQGRHTANRIAFTNTVDVHQVDTSQLHRFLTFYHDMWNDFHVNPSPGSSYTAVLWQTVKVN